MKKILIFIVLVVLVGIGFRAVRPKTPVSTPPQQNTSKVTFTGKTFSFQYPKELSVDTDDLGTQWSSNRLDGTLLAQVIVPRSVQPQTNLSDSKFTVGSSSDATDCLVATNGEIETLQGSTTINGVIYKKFQLDDAAAGNRYDTTSYRTIHGSACYAVEYTIHSTNIGNYDPSQGIKEFDRTSITTALEAMVQSFKFTD